MTKTQNYNLNQWDAADPVRRTDFNADNAAIDAAIKAVSDTAESKSAAAQAAGDRSLDALRKTMGDVCRLAYQADGKGIYTGFRQGFDFDGLNADNRVESFSGAAVLEPDNGQVRLAVDGWSGGEIAMTASEFTSYVTPSEYLSKTWTPVGIGKLTSAAFTVKNFSTTGSVKKLDITVYGVLLEDGSEVATSNTVTVFATTTGGSFTMAFSDSPTMRPDKVYQFKLVTESNITNTTYTMTWSGGLVLTADAVRMPTGAVTFEPWTLSGTELLAWVQYSEPGAAVLELLQDGAWTALERVRTADSEIPEGIACKEDAFRLTAAEPFDRVQLRVTMNSESEYMVYGCGAAAL